MRHLRRQAEFLIAGALAIACVAVWSAVYASGPIGAHGLVFAALDIGQGDALYIQSPTGVQVVIDGGPDDSLLRELPAVMPALDRSLDAVIETHPDADHIAGLVGLLRRYEVASFIEPGIPKDTLTAGALEKEIDEEGMPRIIARRGTVLDLGGGARLEVLYPDHDVSALPSDKANEGGIVARLVYGETEVLLMADVGAEVEARLLDLEGESLQSDVLKVGHHGSRYSSTDAFIQAVSPKTAIISVGKNSYGHPTPQTLGTLRRYGAAILRTDEKGTVECVSDGAAFSCAGEK